MVVGDSGVRTTEVIAPLAGMTEKKNMLNTIKCLYNFFIFPVPIGSLNI